MRIKILLPVLLICFSTNLFAQTSYYKVTTSGISDFKMGMKKEEVEKLVGKPVVLKNLLSKSEWMMDTINYKYKDLDISLIFNKNNDEYAEIVLWGIYSRSTLLKTPSGISIGDDKIKIVTTYDGYTIHISPDYEDDYSVKSKTKSTIYLHGDDARNQIVFRLENNKVYEMGVSIVEEYD